MLEYIPLYQLMSAVKTFQTRLSPVFSFTGLFSDNVIALC